MKNKGVLIIYTGGTIGSMPKDSNDPDSPQVVVDWEIYKEKSPALHPENLGFEVEGYSTKPLDSCNIGPKEWTEMAQVIKERYSEFEGFAILHGTDTMTNTASALSFMLENLGKPVVITGAQMAYLFNVRNDGLQNMITALMVANPAFSKIPAIPEVCICFSNKLLRGNRTRKINANSFDAYISPNYPALAEIGESINVNEGVIRKIDPNKALRINSRLESNVAAIRMFPGIQDGQLLDRVLADPKLKGVVIEAYGAGNIPTEKHILKLIKDASDRGVVILDVTQCGGGKVELGMYETSARLLDVGVVSGTDITPEAALAKLMVILGDEDMSTQEKALRAERSISGEVSTNIFTTKLKSEDAHSIDSEMNRQRVPAAQLEGGPFKSKEIEVAMIRFRGGKINAEEKHPIELQLYLDLSSDDEPDESSPAFLGSFRRAGNKNPTILFFDVTDRIKNVLSDRASITVIQTSQQGSFTWESAELVIFAKETN